MIEIIPIARPIIEIQSENAITNSASIFKSKDIPLQYLENSFKLKLKTQTYESIDT